MDLGACMAQMYLISRVYRLTNSRIVGGILVACSITAFGAGMSLSNLSLTNQGTHSAAVRAYLCIGAAAGTDLLISAVLLVVLWRARREASKFAQSQLKGALTRLMFRTVETGSVMSTIMMAVLGIYLRNPSSLVSRACASESACPCSHENK